MGRDVRLLRGYSREHEVPHVAEEEALLGKPRNELLRKKLLCQGKEDVLVPSDYE